MWQDAQGYYFVMLMMMIMNDESTTMMMIILIDGDDNCDKSNDDRKGEDEFPKILEKKYLYLEAIQVFHDCFSCYALYADYDFVMSIIMVFYFFSQCYCLRVRQPTQPSTQVLMVHC